MGGFSFFYFFLLSFLGILELSPIHPFILFLSSLCLTLDMHFALPNFLSKIIKHFFFQKKSSKKRMNNRTFSKILYIFCKFFLFCFAIVMMCCCVFPSSSQQHPPDFGFPAGASSTITSFCLFVPPPDALLFDPFSLLLSNIL